MRAFIGDRRGQEAVSAIHPARAQLCRASLVCCAVHAVSRRTSKSARDPDGAPVALRSRTPLKGLGAMGAVRLRESWSDAPFVEPAIGARLRDVEARRRDLK